MRIAKTTAHRLAVLATAALSLSGAQMVYAQDTTTTPATDSTPATVAPGASTVTTPTPPAQNDQTPAPAAAAPTAPASAAPAPTPAAPAAAPRLSYSGLIDVYYQMQTNNPKGLSQSALTNGAGVYTPVYNVRNNTPSVSLAELNLVYAAPADGGLGAKATLVSGDTADINHGGLGVDPASFHEAYFKNIQQLYVTYASKSGAGADFGKFYTPFGYEVTESSSNYNYSRSDVYWYLLPLYHAGVRFYTPNMKGLTLTGYIVNALNDTSNEGVHDDNGDKGYIGSINYTDPKGKFVGIETFGYSRDKDASGFDTDKTTLSDTDLTLTPTATSTIGFEYVYRKDDGGDEGRLSSNGYAAYYRYQINPKDAAAFRYSYVDQRADGRPYDLTATYEIKNSSKFLTRFEYRYDKIYGTGFGFADSDGNPTKSSQNTITASEVFSF